MIGEKKLSKIRELYMKDFWFIEKNQHILIYEVVT